ncbi:SOUL family heme-binding protein [Winogradskyella sp. UBA3174]|mgnify:CR=1 FL=1|uniref:SOUL family heme-binding protein n=1 Tax=Winogradskyella sp. UBA3174 TaxID=1947785 RepID=UPI0025EFCE83|nr:heme-binding protein [Winogradskyella sp. UBA3174]
MKIILIIAVILAVIFIISQVYALKSQSGIEQYSFKVIKTYSDIEIRNYEASLFTSVKLTTNDYKKGSREGFSILGGYIFGGNEDNEQISMTSPVAMSLEDSMEVLFMVPKKFNKKSLPKPNASKIEFKEIPAKTVAAIAFGGWSDALKIEKYKEKLKVTLRNEGIIYTNRFYLLGYNPPFEVINRKNEIIVELENYNNK